MKPGKIYEITAPASEAMIHSKLVGRKLTVMLRRADPKLVGKGQRHYYALFRSPSGKWVLSGYTLSELGIYQDNKGPYFYDDGKTEEEVKRATREAIEAFNRVMKNSNAVVINELGLGE